MALSRKSAAALAATVLLAVPLAATAAITGGTVKISRGGTVAPDLFVVVPSPDTLPKLGKGRLDVNDFVFGFDEQVAFLSTPVDVDGGVLAGVTVASHYVFFDPARAQAARGTVTFDFPILGVISTRSELAATDSLLGASGVRYGNARATGLERRDTYAFAGNVLTFDWRAGDPGDHIRVLTAVPEPGTYAMLLAGLALVGFIARRRMGG